MDLITQGLLGATIGQAFFNRSLGRKAVWAGACAGLLPDIDILGNYLGDPMAELKYHRWITHSFWFGGITALPLAYMASRFWKGILSPDEAFKKWFWLFFWALFTHPLLDLFTVYGTQFLAPFSSKRIHWHAIAIVDLGYSLLLVLALVMGARWDRKKQWVRGARFSQKILMVTTVYLLAGLGADLYLTRVAQVVKPGYVIRTHPTLLQPFYRKVYAYHPREICHSTYTFLKPRPLKFACMAQQQHPSIANMLSSPNGQLFLWFADGEICVEYTEKDAATVRLHDLRFSSPDQPFAGLWGLEAKVDEGGNLLEEPRRFFTKRPSIKKMWDAIIPPAFGYQP